MNTKEKQIQNTLIKLRKNHFKKYTQGYFDKYLAENSDIVIVGVEKKQEYTTQANRKQQNPTGYKGKTGEQHFLYQLPLSSGKHS